MATDIFPSDILIHEAQLGDTLGGCVHEQRRADFSLLLAMLTEDVRAHSQFKLPKTEIKEEVISNSRLRKILQLPDETALAVEDVSQLTEYNQAKAVENNQLDYLRLVNTLQPKPLAFRDDNLHIHYDVISNTSLYCQKRHQEKTEQQNITTSQRAEFNAIQWLDAIHHSRVKTPISAVMT